MKAGFIFLLIVAPVFVAYAVLIIRLTLGWFRLPQTAKVQVSEKVSIVIAARNEEANIETCLNSLFLQDYPVGLFEIIVVDDHSEDGTAKKVEAFQASNPQLSVRLLNPGPGSGKKAALRLGTAAASGQYILITDADCTVGPSWISQLTAVLSTQDKLLVSGPVMFQENRGIFGLFQQIEFASLIAAGAGAIGIGQPMLCNGANMGFHKASRLLIDEADLQPHLASGDDVFLLQAFATKFGPEKIGFVKSTAAIVHTAAAPTFSSFWQQRLRWSAKSTAFTSRGPVWAALIVWLTSFLLMVNLLIVWISPDFLYTLLLLFALKSIFDLPLLMDYLRFSGQGKLMWLIVPAQTGVIIYTALLGLFSRFMPVHWKGRKIRSA